MKTLIVFLSFFLAAEVFGASPAFTGFRGDSVFLLCTTNQVTGTVTYSGLPYLLTNGQISAVTFNTSLTLGAVGSANSFRLSYNAGTPSLDVFNSFSGLVQFSFLESGINQSVVDLTVPDEAYGVAWNGLLEVPTKNALFDKIQTLQQGSASLTNLSGNPNVVTNILGAGTVTVTSNNAGTFTITGAAGGGSPNGPDTSVQTSQGGNFFGTNSFTYDTSLPRLFLNEGAVPVLRMVNGVNNSNNVGSSAIELYTNATLVVQVGSSNGGFVVARQSLQSSNLIGTNLIVRGGTIGAGKVLTDVAGDGNYTPQTPSAGGGATRNNISGGTTATNLSLDVDKVFVLTNALLVDVTYALSNLTDGVTAIVYIPGQTNAATNHPVIFTAPSGVPISWQDNGTNGTASFTAFSNSLSTVTFRVYTNQLGTNVVGKWKTDSGWPQPNQPLIAAAGGSRSNIIAGGMYYVDTLPAYTNLNSTIGTFTNLATNVIAGHALTNLWDMYYHRWGLKFRSGFSTNNWQVVLGSQTIFDSGVCTNNVDSGYIETRIWRTDNTNQHCETTLHLGFSSFTGGMTNRNIETTQTNGIDTILQLRGAASRFMSFTNNSSYGKVEQRQ